MAGFIRLSMVLLAWPAMAMALCDFSHRVSSKPDDIYIDHANGTVTDAQTGLMWRKCSLGRTWNGGSDATTPNDDSCTGAALNLTWQGALKATNEMVSHGFADWRMPNVNEVYSLLDYTCTDPAMNQHIFHNMEHVPNTNPGLFWTSTPVAGNGFHTGRHSTWHLSAYYGTMQQSSRNQQRRTLMVRSPCYGNACFDRFYDQFNVDNANQNDGNRSFNGPWLVHEPGGNHIAVESGRLRISRPSGGGANSLYRLVDLSGYSSATLSFSYDAMDIYRDIVELEYTTDGGGSWQLLTTQPTHSVFVGRFSGSYAQDLSAFLVSGFGLRFNIVYGAYSGRDSAATENFYLDEFKIIAQ